MRQEYVLISPRLYDHLLVLLKTQAKIALPGCLEERVLGKLPGKVSLFI